MTTQNKGDMERGLKTEISRQVGLKGYEKGVADFNAMNMIYAWGALIDNPILDTLIWNYVDKSALWVQLNSEKLGIKTIISDYTNKGGKKHLAHTTAYGHYIGPTTKLGNIPIYYNGNFRISKSQFKINKNKIVGAKGFDFFEPINPNDPKTEERSIEEAKPKETKRLEKPRNASSLVKSKKLKLIIVDEDEE